MLKQFDVVYVQTNKGVEKDYIVQTDGIKAKLAKHCGKWYTETDFYGICHRYPLRIGTKVTIINDYAEGLKHIDYPGNFLPEMLEMFAGRTFKICEARKPIYGPSSAADIIDRWGDHFDGYYYELVGIPDYVWTTPMFEYTPTIKLKVPEHKINIQLC